MKKRILIFSLFLFISACSQDTPVTVKPGKSGAHSSDEKINFKLKIENISKADVLKLSNSKTIGISFLPGSWTVYNKSNPFFTKGQKDNAEGLEDLSEDGDSTKLETSAKKKDGYQSSGIFNTIKSGESIEVAFSASAGAKMSFATMFNQSNDLFYSTGANGIELFDKDNEPVKGDFTTNVILWDAGTEENQEPGLGIDQAARQTIKNTGKAENGVIREITEVKDGFIYPKASDVIKITLTNDDVHESK